LFTVQSCHYSIGVPRPQKITFGEMRRSGVADILVFCGDFKCAHMVKMSSAEWPDDVRLSDIEDRFLCKKCGGRGADVRPDYSINQTLHW